MSEAELLKLCRASGITLDEALAEYVRGAKLSERLRLLEIYEANGLEALLVALRDRDGR